MSNATLQIGGGNWAAQDGKLLGYAVEPTSGRYLARELTVDRNSSKWVLGSDGYLYKVPADQPALEYYSDGTFRGALVEPASTNLFLYSESFSNNNWVKNAAAIDYSIGTSGIQSNVAVSPNGSITADRVNFINQSNNDVGLLEIISSGVSGNTFVASFFVKGEGNNIGKNITIKIKRHSGGSFVGQTKTFTLTDKWQRVEVKLTLTAGNIGTQTIISSDINGATSCLLWGAQLEESPIATSYIPTTTDPVTRLKDDIFFTNASSVIGQSEGTLFVEVDWQDSGADQILFNISDNTSSNVIRLIKLNSTSEIKALLQESGGPSEVFIGTSSSAFTGIYKFSFVYKTSDSKLFVNGAEEASSTATLSGFSSTISYIDFGQAQNATVQANMWIRDVRIYNTRLTDTECQDLTTI